MVSSWSYYSYCDEPCGGGEQERTRSILTPAAYGGLECPSPLVESLPCNTYPCPTECEVTPWGDWSDCSATCAGGTHSRNRSVFRPENFAGDECPQKEETRSCNADPCPVDCETTPWTDWTPCKGPCDAGIQMRFRDTIVSPAHGGKMCGELDKSRACEPPSCTVQPTPDSEATTTTTTTESYYYEPIVGVEWPPPTPENEPKCGKLKDFGCAMGVSSIRQHTSVQRCS